MNKESALVALQAIDVIVYKSDPMALSSEDIVDLQGACKSLVQSVQGDEQVVKKAAWIVELIQAAFLMGKLKPGSYRQEILECGISLSLFIQQLPATGIGAGEGVEGEGSF